MIERDQIRTLDCTVKSNRTLLMDMLQKLQYFQDNEATDRNLEKYYWKLQETTNFKISAIMLSVQDKTFTAFCKYATCDPATEGNFQIRGANFKELMIKFIVFARYKKISE